MMAEVRKEYVYIPSEVGSYLRNKRKELGLSQADLSYDDVVSTGTVSNIEKGGCKVSKTKLTFYCEKISIDIAELDDLLHQSKSTENPAINLELKIVEHTMDLISPDQGLNELEKLSIGKDHPSYAEYLYLKGKFNEKKERWSTAIGIYTKAIKVIEKSNDNSNVKAASYHGLSKVFNRLNNIDQALEYVDKGLQCFVKGNGKSHVYYHLLISKVIYLEKVERLGEALEVLDFMEEQKELIPSIEAVLNMYEMRSRIYNRLQAVDKAIDCCLEGLEMARIAKLYDREFELWVSLGESYSINGDIDDSMMCLEFAISLKKNIRRKYLLSSAYTKLGLLHLKTNSLQEAQDHLQAAVNLGLETGDVFRTIEAMEALADVYLLVKDESSATKVLEEALKLIRKQHLLHQKKDVLIKLANCLSEKNPKRVKDLINEFTIIQVDRHHKFVYTSIKTSNI